MSPREHEAHDRALAEGFCYLVASDGKKLATIYGCHAQREAVIRALMMVFGQRPSTAVGPATSPYLNATCRTPAQAALDIAVPVLQRVNRLLAGASQPGDPGDDFLNTRGHAEIAALAPIVARTLADIDCLMTAPPDALTRARRALAIIADPGLQHTDLPAIARQALADMPGDSR